MTEQNMKKLYDWFIESKQIKRAEKILSKYPQFKESSEEKGAKANVDGKDMKYDEERKEWKKPKSKKEK